MLLQNVIIFTLKYFVHENMDGIGVFHVFCKLFAINEKKMSFIEKYFKKKIKAYYQ